MGYQPLYCSAAAFIVRHASGLLLFTTGGRYPYNLPRHPHHLKFLCAQRLIRAWCRFARVVKVTSVEATLKTSLPPPSRDLHNSTTFRRALRSTPPESLPFPLIDFETSISRILLNRLWYALHRLKLTDAIFEICYLTTNYHPTCVSVRRRALSAPLALSSRRMRRSIK